MKQTVGIIGLGLLGGSLAKALKAYTDYDVIGYARRQAVCDQALTDGAVTKASTDVGTIIEQADIVIFALPPHTNGRVFCDHCHRLRPGQIVTDVSSCKEALVQVIYEHLPKGVAFVSIHPMAGSEKGGYGESSKNLFQQMGWIVLTDDHPAYDEQVAEQLAQMGRAVGSRVEWLPMALHDNYLAMVSHMPHMMASIMALVAGGDADGVTRMKLSAGGFRDSTRTAGGLPSMWREIIYDNRYNVSLALQAVMQEIQHVQTLLDQDDGGAGIEHYLMRAKTVRDRLPLITGISKNSK